MISKRWTALIRPTPSPGVNGQGSPTIKVSGSELTLDIYFKVLDLAIDGHGTDDIVADILRTLKANETDSRANYTELINIILINYRLAHAKDLSAKDLPTRTPSRTQTLKGHPKPRISTMPKALKRVTTHISHSDPDIRSPVSPEKEEQQLVADALKLMTERETVNKTMPESMDKRRATAAIDLQLRSSLLGHQAVDDAAILRAFNEQNLS